MPAHEAMQPESAEEAGKVEAAGAEEVDPEEENLPPVQHQGWDTRYKVLWIGEIAKHKGIGETKVLRNFSFIEIPVSELKWAN